MQLKMYVKTNFCSLSFRFLRMVDGPVTVVYRLLNNTHIHRFSIRKHSFTFTTCMCNHYLAKLFIIFRAWKLLFTYSNFPCDAVAVLQSAAMSLNRLLLTFDTVFRVYVDLSGPESQIKQSIFNLLFLILAIP